MLVGVVVVDENQTLVVTEADRVHKDFEFGDERRTLGGVDQIEVEHTRVAVHLARRHVVLGVTGQARIAYPGDAGM